MTPHSADTLAKLTPEAVLGLPTAVVLAAVGYTHTPPVPLGDTPLGDTTLAALGG